ncbi:MAG: SpoIID/LytB domain-containing protein [Candidatus Omnitrophica bacterium]|nr:SpoIID/LytB domain-containing protein [Candidatus Omnitrophota bacterium]
MNFFRLFLTGWLIISFSGVAAAQEPEIRVEILKDVDSFVISVRGVYQIIDLTDHTLLVKKRRLKRSKVDVFSAGITIGNEYFETKKIRIVSSNDITVYSKNKKGRFRGTVDILVDKNNNFQLINRLGLEFYVRGVLFHEVSDKWPIEAIKAQAVATRTYALFRMNENSKKAFDVTSDIFSQVYGGKSAERFRTDMAVNQTTGQVIVFDGKIVPAFFHSNSGGYTEDAKEVWDINLPPLRGVKSPYSQGMPHSQWTRNFRSADVQDILEKKGVKTGLIKDIVVAKRTLSGRVKELIIEGRDGSHNIISGKDFRSYMGPNLVLSNKYEIEMKGYYFDLIGNGWGHGVGLCQWGAYRMAKERRNYEQILKYYYPGVEIQKTEIK